MHRRCDLHKAAKEDDVSYIKDCIEDAAYDQGEDININQLRKEDDRDLRVLKTVGWLAAAATSVGERAFNSAMDACNSENKFVLRIMRQFGIEDCNKVQNWQWVTLIMNPRFINYAFVKVGDLSATGISPLHVAVLHDKIKAATALLIAGADPNVRAKEGLFNFRGPTPLYYAVAYGRYEMVHLLLAYGADQTLEDSSNHSPFMLAASGNTTEAIKMVDVFLKFKKTDCTHISSKGITPLMVATYTYYPPMIKHLIEKKCYNSRTEDRDMALVNAVMYEDFELSRWLLEKHADPNGWKDYRALSYAALLNNVKLMKLLVSYDANPEAGGNCLYVYKKDNCTALEIAAGTRALHAVSWLSNHILGETGDVVENEQRLLSLGHSEL